MERRSFQLQYFYSQAGNHSCKKPIERFFRYGEIVKYHPPIILKKMNRNLKDIKGNGTQNISADSIAYIITKKVGGEKKVFHLTLIVSVTGSVSLGVSFGSNCVSISLRKCGFKIYPEPPLSKNFPI